MSVSGKVAPEREKPVPLTEALLIVTGPLSEEVSVTDSEVVDATFTVP